MTWADIVAGRDDGGVDYVLIVEGWPDIWCTSAALSLSATVDSRTLRQGLKYDGLKISEQAVLRDAWVNVSGITFRITPTLDTEDTINSFTRTPNPVGHLKADLDVATTKVYLDTNTTLAIGTRLHIATETMEVTAVGSDGGGAFMTVTRGKWDTLAQRHLITYGATHAVSVPVYTFPPTMEGRRASLYAKGYNDLIANRGTLIWKGVVSKPPKMESDGVTWSIATDNIVKVLEQKVASADGLEYRIRGVYHPSTAPMTIRGGAVFDAAHASSNFIADKLVLFGFFETQAEWITAVNLLLGLYSSFGYSTYLAYVKYEERSGAPQLEVRMAATLPTGFVHWTWVAASPLDGDLQFLVSVVSERYVQSYLEGSDPYSHVQNPDAVFTHFFGDGSQKFSVVGFDQSNTPNFSYPLSATRAVAGTPQRVTLSTPFWSGPTNNIYGTGNDPTNTAPPNRIYLNSVDGIEVDDVLTVITGDKSTPITVTAIATADADRYITFDFASAEIALYMDENTRLVPLRVFETDGSIKDFAASVVNSYIDANDGDTPYITPNDMDYSALTLAFGGFSSIDDYWKHRNYSFSKPTAIKTILQEELKAIGFMMRLDANGAAAFAPLPLVSGTQVAAATITDNDIMHPSGRSAGAWPGWEAQSDGLVNIVNGRFGYRPADDDFDPTKDFTIKERTSISEHKSNGKGSVDIAPRSTQAKLYVGSGLSSFVARVHNKINQSKTDASPSQVAAWVGNYLRVLSMDYATVTIQVPFKYFNLLIGDIVEVTSTTIPNGQGGRGVTSKRAAVVGREWNLDPKARGMGTLKLYFPRTTSGGYTPSGRVFSQTNLGGNNWSITFNNADAFNVRWSDDGGGDVAKYFATFDAIKVVLVDSLSPTVVTGTVTSTATNTVVVSLSGAWTPGASKWNLIFNTDSASNDRQRQFVYIASTTRQLNSGEYARLFV